MVSGRWQAQLERERLAGPLCPWGEQLPIRLNPQVRGAHRQHKVGGSEAEPQETDQLRTVSPQKAGGSHSDCETSPPEPPPPAPRAWIILRDVFPGLTPRALR